jgi:hypothetical protein
LGKKKPSLFSNNFGKELNPHNKTIHVPLPFIFLKSKGKKKENT